MTRVVLEPELDSPQENECHARPGALPSLAEPCQARPRHLSAGTDVTHGEMPGNANVPPALPAPVLHLEGSKHMTLHAGTMSPTSKKAHSVKAPAPRFPAALEERELSAERSHL